MIAQFMNLSRAERRNAILYMERENKAHPEALREILSDGKAPGPVKVWRSREFLCQLFDGPGGVLRFSVNRTHVDPATLRWVDGITWDDLQRLKREAGFGGLEMVEVYPPDADVVDIANIRHLWIVPTRMPFSWRSA